MTVPISYDPYHALTGKNHPTDATVLEIAEHGRVGGVSTGKPFKQVGVVETPPTDSTKNNSSSLLSFNASDELVYADEIISGVTYRTTFTRSVMTIDHTLAISGAVKQ